jgi:hypothetical protein
VVDKRRKEKIQLTGKNNHGILAHCSAAFGSDQWLRENQSTHTDLVRLDSQFAGGAWYLTPERGVTVQRENGREKKEFPQGIARRRAPSSLPRKFNK